MDEPERRSEGGQLMIALIAYMLRSYTRSQRYFAPFAGLLIMVLMLYSYKPNPVMNSYAATAVMLYIGCAWIGLSFLNHDHPVHRQVTVVHIRSSHKYNVGSILTLAFLTLLLALIVVIYPWITGHFEESPGVYRFILALIGHGLLGVFGIAISLYLQASWVRKSSHSVGIMLVIIILSLGATKISNLVPEFLNVLIWILPPVSPVMDAMLNADNLQFSNLMFTYVHALLYIVILIGFYLYKSIYKDYNKT